MLLAFIFGHALLLASVRNMSLELRVLQRESPMLPRHLKDKYWSKLNCSDASAILYAVAIFTTLYRLYLRLRTRKWHWDDSFALLSVCSMSFFVSGKHWRMGLINRNPSFIFLSGLFLLRGVNSHIETYEAVIAHYFLVLGYNNSIWFALHINSPKFY